MKEGKGRQGTKGGEKVGKWERGLDLDICPGAPEFLVTPLNLPGRCCTGLNDQGLSKQYIACQVYAWAAINSVHYE